MLFDLIIKAMHEAAWIDDFVLVGLVVIAENGGSETALEVISSKQRPVLFIS